MKVFAIITVARQVDGEYVLIKSEGAFFDKLKAEKFVSNLSRQYAETIDTPAGKIACICERGVFEIEVEE